MGKAVFIQNPRSIYDDAYGRHYHFPKMYLNRVRAAVGDWAVIYESAKGRFGYTDIQRVLGIEPDPARADHYYAVMDLGTLLGFERVVPRAAPDGVAYEKRLRGPHGAPASGGANMAAVRAIGEDEFAAIVSFGLPGLAGDAPPGFAEGPVPAIEGLPPGGLRPEILTGRKLRDPAFARMVKAAYRGRCAMSGLELRNGGGRAEVQAAHIRPVKDAGPDVVRNGLALSGTLHWMFDRGLVSVAEDHRILVSGNKVPRDVADRLIVPDRRLRLPDDPRDHPHPEYLRFHREEVFGRGDPP